MNKGIFSVTVYKNGNCYSSLERNLTASIRSKNIPHLNNPTTGNLNTTMYVRTRVFKVSLLIAKKKNPKKPTPARQLETR